MCLAFAFRVESRLVIRDVPRGGELVKFGKAVGAALSLSRRLGRAVALKLRSGHHYPEHFDRSLSDSNHGRGRGNRISRPWYAPTPLHVRYVPKASKALFVPSRPPPGVVNRNYGSNTSNSRQLERHAVPGSMNSSSGQTNWRHGSHEEPDELSPVVLALAWNVNACSAFKIWPRDAPNRDDGVVCSHMSPPNLVCWCSVAGTRSTWALTG